MTRAKTPSKASFDAAKDRVVEWLLHDAEWCIATGRGLPTAYRFYEKARKRIEEP